MNLKVLKEEIEQEAKMKVGLYYKAIYRGKIAVDVDNKTITRAIHVELEGENFNINFKKFVSTYSQSLTGFKNSCHIHFWSHPDLVKSDKAKGTPTKTYER